MPGVPVDSSSIHQPSAPPPNPRQRSNRQKRDHPRPRHNRKARVAHIKVIRPHIVHPNPHPHILRKNIRHRPIKVMDTPRTGRPRIQIHSHLNPITIGPRRRIPDIPVLLIMPDINPPRHRETRPRQNLFAPIGVQQRDMPRRRSTQEPNPHTRHQPDSPIHCTLHSSIPLQTSPAQPQHRHHNPPVPAQQYLNLPLLPIIPLF